jgi:hypothetical protein
MLGASTLGAAGAFGLLTLQFWAPPVTAIALMLGALVAFVDMWLNPMHGKALPALAVAATAAALIFVVSSGVRALYARKAATVTA